MNLTRRDGLKLTGSAALAAALPRTLSAAADDSARRQTPGGAHEEVGAIPEHFDGRDLHRRLELTRQSKIGC